MKMLRNVFAALFIVAACACMKDDDDNDGNTGNSVNGTDQDFVIKASYSNKAEISAGTIASSKGLRDSIRMFGQMMVMDHTTAQASLDSIAGAVNVTPPSGPDSIHIVMAQKLMTLSGHTFDTAYIHGQVMDHQKTIDLFQNEISNGNNHLIKNFANKNLPVIKMHYSMATSISSSE
jgi:putative membrane protein